ncbi:MAG TPA: hypothetical protein DCS83_06960 [Prevotella sp.]|nr:hypothetical protein [Prevotella sp.]
MSVPIDIDDYQRYLPVDNNQLKDMHVPDHVIQRLTRIRGLYSFWLQFPNKTVNELVIQDIGYNQIGKSEAYDDIHLVQVLLGNLQQSTKDFWRWKINAEIEQDMKKARTDGDWKSVASMQKNLIKNNRTDQPDDIQLQYDRIIPQQFEPCDDPTVIGIKPIPNLRQHIKELNAKYKKGSNVEDADFEEVKDDE